MCGGNIDKESDKCTTCGGKPPPKKKTGKKMQISMVKDISKKDSNKIEVPTEEEKPEIEERPQLSTKPVNKTEEDEALAKWLSGEDDKEALGEWLGGAKPSKTKTPTKKETKGETKTEAKDEIKGDEQPDADAKTQAEPKKEGDGEGADALKKWLSGEEDTLKDWLGDDEGEKSSDAKIEPVGKDRIKKDKDLQAREDELNKKEEELESLKFELNEFKKIMETNFEKVKTGDFDPLIVLEETAKLNKELQSEIKKRKQLEGEVTQIKKGSLAVIKYVKAQQMQDKGGVAKSLKKKLDEEVSKREKFEAELKSKSELVDELKKEITKGLDKMPEDAKKIKEKEIDLIEKEKDLQAKVDELKAKEKTLEQKIKNGTASSDADSDLQQKLMAELTSKEQEFIEKEAEMRKRILELEENVQESEIDRKLQAESDGLKGKTDDQINEELTRKVREIQVKEKSLLLREDEIQRLKEQLKQNEVELKKIKEPLAYKEEEVLRREEDLVYREQMLIEERRKVEEAMRESGSMEAHEMKKKLEELNNEIKRKEDEVRAKEKYVQSKMEDLRIREQGLIGEEIEAREEDRLMELKIEKVKTGDRRLDDLLLGGIPFGSNILVYGPAFTGKEIVINSFMAEGLKKGVPGIWIITNKLPSEIREEMMFILSGYEEYEKRGLIKYIDAYSRSIGVDDVEENVTYVEDPTDFKAIDKAVDDAAKSLLENHDYYRIAFRSVSTLISYLDSNTAFKFLQPFCGKRKRERAVSMYAIEKGMHNEQDIQMIGSVTDGMIDFKLEQLKTFLSIKGVGDVQSRAWIDYTYSKQGLIIGSFSLDHIR